MRRHESDEWTLSTINMINIWLWIHEHSTSIQRAIVECFGTSLNGRVAGGHSLAVVSFFLVSCQVIRHFHMINSNVMCVRTRSLRSWNSNWGMIMWTHMPIWVSSIIMRISSSLVAKMEMGIKCNAGILDTRLWFNQFTLTLFCLSCFWVAHLNRPLTCNLNNTIKS